jgi:hypothetical protein
VHKWLIRPESPGSSLKSGDNITCSKMTHKRLEMDKTAEYLTNIPDEHMEKF